MANNLTGDYEAVVQVSVNAINGILATLHQNGATKDASPSFLHSFSMRIGDPSTSMSKGNWRLARWSHIVAPKQGQDMPQNVGKQAPPGVSADLTEALRQIQEEKNELLTPPTVRGLAQVQLSTPWVSFTPGATSKVMGHIQLRAHYIPEPGALSLPEPIHGEVGIVFTIQILPKPDFNIDVLEVGFPQNDNDIQFTAAAGTGLSPADVDKLETHIRAAVRENFEPTNQPLPEGFEFHGFKALGSGNSQVVALPVRLSDAAAAPTSALNTLNNVAPYVTTGFGVGVRKEFVISLVQPSLDLIKASHPQFIVSGPLGSATYTTNFTQAVASWVNGKIHLNIQGNATTPKWWAPNVGSFSIQQNLTLQFDGGSQTLMVIPEGEPGVNVNVNGPFGGLVEDMVTPTVRDAFIAQRTDALNNAQTDIQKIFSGSGNLGPMLQSFDPQIFAQYTGVQTNQDGFILHGSIYTKTRPGPSAQFTETGDEKGFSALQSWIPGGVIDQFAWSWLEKTRQYEFLPWKQTVKYQTDNHRFVLPKPDGNTSSFCLWLKGQFVHSGHPAKIDPPGVLGAWHDVEGGDTCNRSGGREFVFTMPSFWVTIMTPIWGPDPGPESILEEAISAHVEAISPRPGETGANTIVHFTDLDNELPLDVLGEGLANLRNDNKPLALALVLPRGSFGRRRRDLERRLGTLEDFTGSLVITEDYQGGWSKTFAVEDVPATYITNARGEFVWKHQGALNVDNFSAALKEHLISAPEPRARLLQLSVKVGDRAPDVLLESIVGGQLALRKLRGRSLVFFFWQSWSTPCVKELRRLQRLHDSSKGDDPTLLAIHVGGSREQLVEFKRQHELSITLVADTQRRISERYGVRCWPTTVSIDGRGLVNNIKFGVHHTHQSAGR